MRGSASSVLTATELVNRKGQILTPWGQNQHPSTDHQNFVTVEYVDDPYICAKFGANSSHRKPLWKWVKYICKELFIYLFTYLFIYIFFGNSITYLQVRAVGRFSHLMAQTTWNHARICLVDFCWNCNQSGTWVVFLKPNPAQNFCTQLNPWKLLPDPAQPSPTLGN